MKDKNVIAVQAAVWDTPGTIELYVNPDNRGDHQVYKSEESREHYSVPSVTIDDYAKGETYDFIKMDIQGAEGRALRGMRETFKRRLPTAIFTEFWPHGLRNAGTPPEEVFDRLLELGYLIYWVNEVKRRYDLTTLPEIYEFCDLDWKFVDLLCVLPGYEPI
jgi:hypothetical protein